MEYDDKENSDKILIKDLTLRCIIGVKESERREKQDVVINIILWSDLTKATETDDIDETIDYKKINKSIIGLVENSKFFLVETLAERIAQLCLQNERVRKVKVSVEKPGALRFARSVGTEVFRKKD
ncbi:MAG TPA: dihydroneopterin aldolase [Candidatus Bathyarchaeia archaeon]|nr:dihydroneopterin aldolase [Candidatus Bathyarchaeia archaeon]